MKDTSCSTNRYAILATLGDDESSEESVSTEEKEETPICLKIGGEIGKRSGAGEIGVPKDVVIRSASLHWSTEIPLELQTLDSGERFVVSALLDSGATGMFIDSSFVEEKGFETRKLARAIPVYNVDGTPNEGGSLREEITLIMCMGEHTERATFYVCNLGSKAIIVGPPWLGHHNPEIDWSTGKVTMSRCPKSCGVWIRAMNRERRSRWRKAKKENSRLELPPLFPDMEEEDEDEMSEEMSEDTSPNWEDGWKPEKDDRLFIALLHAPDCHECRACHINATETVSTRLAAQAKATKPVKTFEELVPEEYH